MEKARQLVTSALNTPSLNRVNELLTDSETKLPIAHAQNLNATSNSKAKQSQVDQTKKSRVPQTKPLPSAEVSVTPLVTYRQVATGAVSLENIQKQLQSRPPDVSIDNFSIF